MAETISVALPVYNGALYLEQQLNSILEQLEPGDEIVAAYQPSSDNSLEILERYQRSDERVKILHNDRKGITSNFQLALEYCGGDYIFLCDQDDVWLPEKRQSVVSAFRSGGADLILHDAVHTDETLNRQNKTFLRSIRWGPGNGRTLRSPA